MTWRYQLIAGAEPARAPLVLLHGSGRDEQDMVPLAAKFAPGSTAVAVRGAIPWERGYAFFRRFEDRSIDEASVLEQGHSLAEFINDVGVRYGFQKPPILIGFSNGAIMAAALIQLYPDLMGAAVLLRPLSPFATPHRERLPGTPVLIIDGSDDERRTPGDGLRLAKTLEHAGAVTRHHVLNAGHSIGPEDCAFVRDWLVSRR
ncbi:esterase [Sinorhizobium numidicum]|uniref:Esterase n=1 Tax=Sinorhizobium numidicum TaxID=680248 RepID=A0ABY8CUG0_9HYPH|nr:esterase [Sinorhizobium numidicum]WEX74645.1 esterase [Sinorhizobium numidicum]WEX80636.1 esterase [Sinorhizobium numidicum]